MYPKKVPKSEKPDTSWYTIHHCHDIALPVSWNSRTDYYDVVSIDPGRKNFAIRIERRNLITYEIKALAFEKIDLVGKDKEDSIEVVDSMYKRINDFLDKYLHLIKLCHVVIIERQLHINYKMVRFSQHIISYLTINLRNAKFFPVILEVSSKLKSHQLQAPKGISDKEIKKWAISKADQLLKIRKDDYSLSVIAAAKKKKDDLSDTIVQIEAIFSLFQLQLTVEAPLAKVDLTGLDIKPKININLSTLGITKLNI
jgi:hypothetical protein